MPESSRKQLRWRPLLCGIFAEVRRWAPPELRLSINSKDPEEPVRHELVRECMRLVAAYDVRVSISASRRQLQGSRVNLEEFAQGCSECC